MKTDFAYLFSGLLVALASCQQDTTDLPPTEENLSGNWEYLGSWENGKLQQDTFRVYFPEVEAILSLDSGAPNKVLSLDTTGYEVVTDSGVWKITEVKNQGVVVAERQRYLVAFAFADDTGYLYNLNPNRFLFDTLKFLWSSNPPRVYAEAIVDDLNKADTILAAEEGTIELIHKDTVQIRWNHGSTTKFKRAVLISNH